MLKNILTVLRKLASAAMNFLIVYFETIAVPMSWAMGGTIMFTMYTELSNLFNGAVCLLVGLWQLGCIFTGRELPLWLKRLKFISTSCLAMTFLTVVIILAPMYEDGNGWYIMLFTGSMLYHHFLDPVLAILSLGVLPIILGISMWLQQKLNPAPTDPTQAMIFAWMPWIFMFTLGSFASGLVLYWITNNLLTFSQQYMIMRSHGYRPDLMGNIKSTFKKSDGTPTGKP